MQWNSIRCSQSLNLRWCRRTGLYRQAGRCQQVANKRGKYHGALQRSSCAATPQSRVRGFVVVGPDYTSVCGCHHRQQLLDQGQVVCWQKIINAGRVEKWAESTYGSGNR